jgi:hypothetical protein
MTWGELKQRIDSELAERGLGDRLLLPNTRLMFDDNLTFLVVEATFALTARNMLPPQDRSRS